MAHVVGAGLTNVEAQFDTNVRPARTLVLTSFLCHLQLFSNITRVSTVRVSCKISWECGDPYIHGACSAEQFECS